MSWAVFSVFVLEFMLFIFSDFFFFFAFSWCSVFSFVCFLLFISQLLLLSLTIYTCSLLPLIHLAPISSSSPVHLVSVSLQWASCPVWVSSVSLKVWRGMIYLSYFMFWWFHLFFFFIFSFAHLQCSFNPLHIAVIRSWIRFSRTFSVLIILQSVMCMSKIRQHKLNVVVLVPYTCFF